MQFQSMEGDRVRDCSEMATAALFCGLAYWAIDTAIRRWQKYTGERAIRLADGKHFDDLTVSSETVSG